MYVHYDLTTGRICGFMEIPTHAVELNRKHLEAGTDIFEWDYPVDPELYYSDLMGGLKLRPTINTTPAKLTLAADGVDSAVLTNLPIPCQIAVDDTEYTVDDGVFEFATLTQGTYQVTAKQFPYVSKTWEVEAV